MTAIYLAIVRRLAWLSLCLAVGVGVMASGSAHAYSVTRFPTVCYELPVAGGFPWVNINSVKASDGATANVTMTGGGRSNGLACTGYGFSIPATATITGIRVDVQRRASGSAQDGGVSLFIGGVVQPVDRSSPDAYTSKNMFDKKHGGTTDLWGATWTPGDINRTDFGVWLSVLGSGTSPLARVDALAITVSYDLPFPCTPPANTPAELSLTCVCDTFKRGALNPSPIFNANWMVSTRDATTILPGIVNSGYLRLTNATADNAKAATLPAAFPASGNYISVEFAHYAYGGVPFGAVDYGGYGMAVTFSDYAVPAVPGAYGGSLGYAQNLGGNGFAGGWLGIGLDEVGDFQDTGNSMEESVSIHGSGSGMAGYGWLGGTDKLTRYLDENDSTTPSRGDFYQVIVDARGEPNSTAVVVNRDSGGGYTQLLSLPNVYSAAQAKGLVQSPAPAFWQISFTGSTGSGTNIHEISALRVCAQTVVPPMGGVANEFNAIDEAYGLPAAVQHYLRGHLYQKVVGLPFKLNVAALSNSQVQTNYVVSGTKPVTLKLVDNSDGACILDSAQANYCSATCKAKAAVTGGQQTLTFAAGDAGQKQSADFTLNTAYQNLVALISDGSTTACSTDAFSVRPTGIASVVSRDANNVTAIGLPVFRAGGDPFSLTLTTVGVVGAESGYTGVAKVNNEELDPVLSAAVVSGRLEGGFPAATSAIGSSTATGTGFTYSEVGIFYLWGWNPAVDATRSRGVYDDTWGAVDSAMSQNDCLQGNYRNTKDANGKYGCNFGLLNKTARIGRFIPHHFALTPGPVAPACGGAFSYFGQDGFTTSFALTAQNAGNATTQNYTGALARLPLMTWSAGPASAANPGFGFSTSAALPAGATLATSATAPSGAWNSGVALVSAKHQVGRPAALTGETAVTVTALPVDGDGVTLPAAAAIQSASTPLRYGRLALFNAFGSEKSALQLPMQLQYWSGKSWVTNSADTCTAITAPNFAFSFPVDTANGLAACETAIAVNGMAPNYVLSLAAPGAGNAGWANVVLNLGATASGNRCVAVGGAGAAAMTVNAPWLQYSWGGVFGNPSARATFGVYSPETRKAVHVRELF